MISFLSILLFIRIEGSSLLEKMGYAEYYYWVTYPVLLFALGTVIWLVIKIDKTFFPENWSDS